MKKKLICISCPVGCHLTITSEGKKISVSGNQCVRGKIYGKEEMLSPRRIVTAVVKIKSRKHSYIPVKTNKPLLKEKIKPLLRKLYSMDVELPVKSGDAIIKNYNNTGVNIVFTRSMR